MGEVNPAFIPMTVSKRTIAIALFWIIGASVALWWYLLGCKLMWKSNLHWSEFEKGTTYDQVFYVKRAAEHATDEFQHPDILPRSRMPLYPWFISHFYDGSKDEVAQFETYKRLNVTISCLALIAIGVLGVRRLGAFLGATVVLATAFTFFLFKAVLVQPEISFFCLFAFLFLLMIDSLRRPTWKGALGIGIFAGIIHLIKGSALPSIYLYALFSGLHALLLIWRNRKSVVASFWERIKPLNTPTAFVAGFLLIAGVHMFHSWKFYGSPMYDPNSRYYLWGDSPEEMAALQDTDLAERKPSLNKFNIQSPLLMKYLEQKWLPDPVRRAELLKLVEEKQFVLLEGEWDILPGFKNWRANHTLQDAIDRIWNGFMDPQDGLYYHNLTHRNNYFYYVLAFIFGAAGSLLLMLIFKPKVLWAAILENIPGILFALGSIIGSLVFYAWWAHMSRSNRFFLTQFLPILLGCGTIIYWASSQITWKTFKLPFSHITLPKWLGGFTLPGPIVLIFVFNVWQTLDNDVRRASTLDQILNKRFPDRTAADFNLVQ